MPDAQLPPAEGDAAEPRPDSVSQPSATPSPGSKPGPAGKAKPRRRRRWPWVVAALLLLPVLLVVLLPTIASTGAVRSIVLGQVNKSLNGRVEIEDWSLGWLSGTKVTGLRVFDGQGAQVVELPSLTTGLTLLNALQGKYDLGQTTIKGLDANVKRYADGTNTFDRLLKGSESPKKPEAERKPEPEKKPDGGKKPEPQKAPPARVPYFSGDVRLVDCRATIDEEATAAEAAHTVQFTAINGSFQVADPNSPITNDLTVVARVDNGPPGTLALKGTVAVIRDNQVSLNGATADEVATVQGFDLKAASAMLKPGSALDAIAGVTDGSFHVQLDRKGLATITPLLQIKDLALGGAALKGDQIRATAFTLNSPPIAIDTSSGLDLTAMWGVTIGDGQAQQLVVTATQGNVNLLDVRLGAKVNMQALLDAAKDVAAAAPASAHLSIHVDLGALAKQAPKAFAAGPDMQITAGTFDTTADLTVAGTQRTFVTKVDLLGATGRNTKEKKDINFEPVHLTADATAAGGSWLLKANTALAPLIDNYHQLSPPPAAPKEPPTGPVVSAASVKAALANQTIGLSVRAVPAKDGSGLALQQISAVLGDGQPLTLDLSGPISDAASRGVLDGITAKITYDMTPLWPILHALMEQPGQADAYADLQIAGKSTRVFTLRGTYPKDTPFNKAIATVSGGGSLGLDSLSFSGVNIQPLELPISLTNGVVTLADSTKPAGQQIPQPMACNGGNLRLGDPARPNEPITLDLTQEHPRLSAPDNLKLLDSIRLDPVFSDALGRWISNPLMVKPRQTSGVTTLTILEMHRLPVDSRVNDYDPTNDGTAKLSLTIQNVMFDNPVTGQLASQLGSLPLGNLLGQTKQLVTSLQGDVKNYTVSIAKGVTSHDMTLTLAEHDWPVRLYGNVRMDTRELLPVSIHLPPELLGHFGLPKQLVQALPKGVELPMYGFLSSPQFDFNSAIQRNATSNFGNVLSGKPQDVVNLIQSLGGKGGKSVIPNIPGLPGASGTPANGANPPPAESPKPADIIGGLLNKVEKDKDKKEKDKEKKEREKKAKKEQPSPPAQPPPETQPASQ